MKNTDCWGAMLAQEVKEAEDTLICSTLSKSQGYAKFNRFWGKAGCSFTAWGEKYVYFPASGAEAQWVARVPRNPCDERTKHIGG